MDNKVLSAVRVYQDYAVVINDVVAFKGSKKACIKYQAINGGQRWNSPSSKVGEVLTNREAR